MEWEDISRYIKAQGWLILLIAGLLSSLFMSSSFTLGVILGGLIVIANFNALQHTIRSAFSPQGRMKNKKGMIIAKYYLRLAILGVIIYTLTTTGWVNLVGLIIGLSVVVVNILFLGIRLAIKTSSVKVV